jgi:hypothetical protein
MTLECPHCHAQNPKGTLWCSVCNKKIQPELRVYSEDIKLPLHSQSQEEERLSYSKKSKSPRKRMFRIILYLVILTLLFIIVLVVFVCLSPYQINPFLSSAYVASFAEDYAFQGDQLSTNDGWIFTITPVKDFQMTARILHIQTYSPSSFPYRPINTFSPIDLVLGIDDIVDNPDTYTYRITYSHDREVRWYFDGSTSDYSYFTSHTGNHHLIPHNEDVFTFLTDSLNVNDVITIEGTLVNLYGTKGNQYYCWDTDTSIGNYPCEIVLVEKIKNVL